jgi:hypothetical protein
MVPNANTQNPLHWQIADGMTVYGSDGEKLGTVRHFDPQAEYLDVQRGWLFHKDFFVPLSEVTSTDEDGITLRLTKQQLDDDRFTSPPTGGVLVAEAVVTDEPVLTMPKEPWTGEHEEVPVMAHVESATGF